MIEQTFYRWRMKHPGQARRLRPVMQHARPLALAAVARLLLLAIALVLIQILLPAALAAQATGGG
jgi:hypothetical protein